MPFSFIPSAGSQRRSRSRARRRPGCGPWKSASPARSPSRGVIGYRYDLPAERLTARFTPGLALALSTAGHPDADGRTRPSSARRTLHTLYGLQEHAGAGGGFKLAKTVLETYFRRTTDGNARPWLFPQLLADCAPLAGGVRHLQGQRVPAVAAAGGAGPRCRRPHLPDNLSPRPAEDRALKPILRPVRPGRLHALRRFRHHAPGLPRPTRRSATSTTSWRTRIPGSRRWPRRWRRWTRCAAYVKNQNLGFIIPYTINGEEHSYIPGLHRPHRRRARAGRPANLIVEVSGQAQKDKAAKVAPRGRCGCRRSTTTAASGAGRSSRSPIRGTRRTRFGRCWRGRGRLEPNCEEPNNRIRHHDLGQRTCISAARPSSPPVLLYWSRGGPRWATAGMQG